MHLIWASRVSRDITAWLLLKGRETRASRMVDQYCLAQTLHVCPSLYAYIDPQNHLNVGIYGSPMECLGRTY